MSQIAATEWIWRDGEFIPWADAHVHVLSHSMQFGSSAFEGIRCYATPDGPAIFRLREHLTRLINSVKIYRMELDYSLDELVAACCALVVKNKMEACYLRPMVVRGYGAAGMVPYASPIHVYLPCWPWGGVPRRRGAGARGRCLCLELAPLRAEHDSVAGQGRRQLPGRAADQDGGAGERVLPRASR